MQRLGEVERSPRDRGAMSVPRLTQSKVSGFPSLRSPLKVLRLEGLRNTSAVSVFAEAAAGDATRCAV